MMVLTPDKLAAAGTEHSEQVALFAAINAEKPFPELRLLFAVPNGGKRDQITASRMKAEGVKRGVPDLCLPVARRGYNALYIELKQRVYETRKNGGCSLEQLEWHALLREQGNFVALCFGWEHAYRVLKGYLS